MDCVDKEQVGTVIGELAGRRITPPGAQPLYAGHALRARHEPPCRACRAPRSSGTAGTHSSSLANRTVVLKSPCW